MNLRLLILPLVIVISLLTSSFRTPQGTGNCSISITVTNVRNSNGVMQFQLFRNARAFSDENYYKQFRVSKSGVKNNTLTYKITGLYPGTYGVALIDDENSNKKMDYGWVLPEEGFGFSDYYHTAWSKPSFNKFKFELKSTKSVTMKIRYL